jgi:ribosomal protein S1
LDDPWIKIPSETITLNSIVKGEIAEIGYSYIACSLMEGIEGRIAIADLSWESADTNRNRLKNYTMGQIIEAIVIEIDIVNRIIYLSIKDLCKNPAIEFFEKHKNTYIKGTVEKIIPTGLFLSLSSSINGFVPKSEVSWFYMKDLSSRHNIGEMIDVKVMAYDSEHENVICSIRATQQNDFDKIASRLTQGDVVKGKVLKYLEDKAEVQIEVDGLYGYGFVHKSQISHVLFISDDLGPKILMPNYSYQFVILEVNTNFKTFALSRKAYYEKTIDKIIYGSEYMVNIIPTPSLTYVCNEVLEGILIGDSPDPSLPANVIPAKIDKSRNRIEMTISKMRRIYS